MTYLGPCYVAFHDSARANQNVGMEEVTAGRGLGRPGAVDPLPRKQMRGIDMFDAHRASRGCRAGAANWLTRSRLNGQTTRVQKEMESRQGLLTSNQSDDGG